MIIYLFFQMQIPPQTFNKMEKFLKYLKNLVGDIILEGSGVEIVMGTTTFS